MPVYRAQNKKTSKAKSVLLFLVVVAVLFAVLYGFSVYSAKLAADALAEKNEDASDLSGEGPTAALEAIYETCEIRGVSTANAVVLDEQFGISTDLYLKAWGRYTNGTYGIADVFIFRTLEDHEDDLREALEHVKTNRIVECRSYDIYNSLEIAESAQIFQVGDSYMCLVMIEDPDAARDIIEDCLN